MHQDSNITGTGTNVVINPSECQLIIYNRSDTPITKSVGTGEKASSQNKENPKTMSIWATLITRENITTTKFGESLSLCWKS